MSERLPFLRGFARPSSRRNVFTQLAGLSFELDLVIHALVFGLQLIVHLLVQQGEWAWVIFTTYITVAAHLLVLAFQILRPWPPLFSGKVIGLAGVMYWFLLEPFQNGGVFDDKFYAETVIFGLLLVQGFTLTMVLTYHILNAGGRPLTDAVAWATPEPRNAGALALIIIIGGVLFLTPIFALSARGPLETLWGLVKSRSGGSGGSSRGNLGDETSVLRAMGYFLWASSTLASLFLLRVRGRTLLKAPVMAVMGLALTILFLSGSRQRLGLAVLPIMGVLYLGLFDRFRHSRLKLNVMLVGFLGFMYLAFQVQNYGRIRGFDKLEQQGLMRALERPAGHQMFIEVLYAAEVFPKILPYSTPGSALFFVLINPIPRAVWPGKPVDPIWRDYSRFRAGSEVEENEGATVAISVVGQFYGEGGIFMVFFAGLLFGIWAFLVDDLLRHHGRRPAIVCIATILATLLLLSYRGLNAGLLYAAPATYILLYFARFLEFQLRLRHNLENPKYLGGIM